MIDRQLSEKTLHLLPAGIEVPSYDRSMISNGMVHIGVGAFHRAHQAAYVDDCLSAGENDWGVVGVSLRSKRTREALEPQDNLFKLAVRNTERESLRVIGSITDILVLENDPEPPHLPAAIKLVDRLPNQKFVVDHIAKPAIAQRVLKPWRSLINEIADRPNVFCKLSCVITQAHWQNWKTSDIMPYLDIVLDAFGTDRIMIGSDWPVSTCLVDYEATMGLLVDWSKQLSASEQAAFLGDNCARFYGVER